MPDNPELDRHWAGDPGIPNNSSASADRIAQFTEDRKERRQYNEGVRNVIEAQTEAVRTLTAKVNRKFCPWSATCRPDR